ncbi:MULTISPECIES: hypothetical protein [unclassified Nostoc]|uniref:hypothetical protein n=1 Tax=unclassified Nostoc TaxID=2593658 RepID=UPI00261364CF|nr:hypothetical protein [Nostoc sp. S13]MDF5734538.1 hypothetical protein [Nostoc sp. S13]
MRTFLSAYTIRIEKKINKKSNDNHPPNYRQLNCFNGHDDLLTVMSIFIQKLTINRKNDTYNIYMKASNIQEEGRSISGLIESGIYGISSNLRDVDTDSITYKKKKSDAEVLPFYFLIYIPKDTNEGILLLQRTGKYGIRTHFGIFLDKYFSDKFPGFAVEINTLVQEEIIKRILYGGTIKKVRCVKYQAPIDRVDGLDEGHQEIPYNMEIVLSANKIPFMGKIQNFFNSTSSVKSLIELRDFNFDYDTVKVDVDLDGSLRTFDLGCLQRARAYYDISDQVVIDSDDYPTLQSIQTITKIYLKEVINQMYP